MSSLRCYSKKNKNNDNSFNPQPHRLDQINMNPRPSVPLHANPNVRKKKANEKKSEEKQTLFPPK